jgi:hypothetical protein
MMLLRTFFVFRHASLDFEFEEGLEPESRRGLEEFVEFVE